MQARSRVAAACLCVALVAAASSGQSGRQSGSERGKQVLHIVVQADGTGKGAQLTKDDFDLFEGGAPQTLETLQLDQSPARIALLVDNTKTLKIGVDQLKKAAHSLI